MHFFRNISLLCTNLVISLSRKRNSNVTHSILIGIILSTQEVLTILRERAKGEEREREERKRENNNFIKQSTP